ncbi:MAG: GNAT family N-acetyltransferase [Arcobacter sp.]|jgi:histone acetyltransferase (RNA polymerase elongator complex component)|uniref:GNAT family N-acetyltransferase n=1 Tax=Arcobacter sp. TaxID=1872629 RepID=UPI002A756B6B|nr:GNAT family N-acetyltransferase [Arcobacter sp.]MDY3199777.1 GNAT family N-acetyltransferase [Arcobacter sp.]
MNLQFKELQKEEIKEVIVLINQAYRAEKKDNAWTTESHLLSGIRVNEDMMKEILEEKDTKTYIAKIENKIVGTIQAKLEGESIHIGLFAVDTKSQASGIGKKLLEFAENSSSKLWGKSTFIMEVISTRTELMQYYIRRGYLNTNSFIEFPKSEYWKENTNEELKLLVLKKIIQK